jgi:hypothetical protein
VLLAGGGFVETSAATAASLAASKAEAGGGRAARIACTEQESTNDSDHGGDAPGDALSLESSCASDTSSGQEHLLQPGGGAARPPECAAKLLFGYSGSNRSSMSAGHANGIQHRVGSRQQGADSVKV